MDRDEIEDLKERTGKCSGEEFEEFRKENHEKFFACYLWGTQAS